MAGSYASEQSQCLIQFCFDETTKQFTQRKELPGFEDAKYLSYVNKKLAAVCRRNAAGITLWDISCDKTMTHLSETKHRVLLRRMIAIFIQPIIMKVRYQFIKRFKICL